MWIISVLYISGLALALFPMAHHYYLVSQVLPAAGSLRMIEAANPELPLYLWSALIGTGLIVAGLLLGVHMLYRMHDSEI